MYSNETRLRTLRLGGFQVFLDTVEISVAPITLLYGPNSAGKSAVYDALDLLRRFWTTLPADADANGNSYLPLVEDSEDEDSDSELTVEAVAYARAGVVAVCNPVDAAPAVCSGSSHYLFF